MNAPTVGTFIHKEGTCYAVEVTAVFPATRGGHPCLPRLQGRRWGFKDGRPFNDGYRGSLGLSLRYRGPGYWTQPDYWNPLPSVWREVPGPDGPKQAAPQLDLFGAAA